MSNSRLYNQHWYMQRMQALGYQVTPMGMCLGLAHMGMQAILSQETKIFDERLYKINEIGSYIFAETYERIKLKLLWTSEYAALKAIQVELKDNDLDWDKILKNEDEKTKFRKEMDDAILTLDADKKQQWRNLSREYIKQQKFLNANDRLLFESIMFFDGIYLYMRHLHYKDILDIRKSGEFKIDLAQQLLAPVKLDENLSSISSFSGVYTKDDLVLYLKSLRKNIDEFKPSPPISLVLVGNAHAISIGYDSGKFIYIEPNDLPSVQLNDEDIIAERIFNSLNYGFYGKHVAFSTQVFVKSENEKHFTTILNQLQNSKEWIEIHAITKEKATANKSALLFMATMKNDITLVESLLAANANFNESPAIGNVLAIQNAALSGNYDIVKKLLEAKQDPNVKDLDGVTVLNYALHGNHKELIRLLLKSKADPNLSAVSGAKITSPLYTTISNKNYQNTINIELLLEAKADIDRGGHDGASPLLAATGIKDIEIIKLLLDKKANPNLARTADNLTPLLHSTGHKDIEIMKLLLAGKADPNLARTDKATALLVAAQDGFTTGVTLLLQAKADVNVSLASGTTPLSAAVRKNRIETVELLLKAKADVNIEFTDCGSKRTPLIGAICEKNEAMVRLLLDAKADLNYKGGFHTPLAQALNHKNEKIFKLLLDAKADPNSNMYDVPILNCAVQSADVDIIKYLLEAGGDPNTGYLESIASLKSGISDKAKQNKVDSLIKSKNNNLSSENEKEEKEKLTLLHRAVLDNHPEIVSLLLEKKANVDSQLYGITALELAEAMEHNEIIHLLRPGQKEEVQTSITEPSFLNSVLSLFGTKKEKTVEKSPPNVKKP